MHIGAIRLIFGARDEVYVLSSNAKLTAYTAAKAVLSPVVQIVDYAAKRFLCSLTGSSLLRVECGPLLTALNTHDRYNQRLRHHKNTSGMRGQRVRGLDKLGAQE